MARNPDRLCAGGCGKLVWRGSGSLDRPTCRDCRRNNQSSSHEASCAHVGTCAVCGAVTRCNGKKLNVTCGQACEAAWASIRQGGTGKTRKGRTCEVCGVTYKASHANQRACGRECGLALGTQGRCAKICAQCGCEYVGHGSSVTCSERCAKARADFKAKARAKTQANPKPPKVGRCAYCGQAFTTTRAAKYCSAECRNARHRDKAKARRDAHAEARVTEYREWWCIVCGASMIHPAYVTDARYCSSRCRRRATGAGENRKRARKFGVPYEPINRAKLYERDGWRCYLCGVKVREYDRARPADPRMATMDHIIAMRNGGGHTWDNVRTCCFRCNVDKSTAEITVQLHMI